MVKYTAAVACIGLTAAVPALNRPKLDLSLLDADDYSDVHTSSEEDYDLYKDLPLLGSKKKSTSRDYAVDDPNAYPANADYQGDDPNAPALDASDLAHLQNPQFDQAVLDDDYLYGEMSYDDPLPALDALKIKSGTAFQTGEKYGESVLEGLRENPASRAALEDVFRSPRNSELRAAGLKEPVPELGDGMLGEYDQGAYTQLGEEEYY